MDKLRFHPGVSGLKVADFCNWQVRQAHRFRGISFDLDVPGSNCETDGSRRFYILKISRFLFSIFCAVLGIDAAQMKHRPIALAEEETPSIYIIPQGAEIRQSFS